MVTTEDKRSAAHALSPMQVSEGKLSGRLQANIVVTVSRKLKHSLCMLGWSNDTDTQ